MKLNHLKSWMAIAFMAILLALMLLIIKHYNSNEQMQQQIDTHWEITDTV